MHMHCMFEYSLFIIPTSVERVQKLITAKVAFVRLASNKSIFQSWKAHQSLCKRHEIATKWKPQMKLIFIQVQTNQKFLQRAQFKICCQFCTIKLVMNLKFYPI